MNKWFTVSRLILSFDKTYFTKFVTDKLIKLIFI